MVHDPSSHSACNRYNSALFPPSGGRLVSNVVVTDRHTMLRQGRYFKPLCYARIACCKELCSCGTISVPRYGLPKLLVQPEWSYVSFSCDETPRLRRPNLGWISTLPTETSLSISMPSHSDLIVTAQTTSGISAVLAKDMDMSDFIVSRSSQSHQMNPGRIKPKPPP